MTIVVDGWDGEASLELGSRRDGRVQPGAEQQPALRVRRGIVGPRDPGLWLRGLLLGWAGLDRCSGAFDWVISGDGEDVSFDLEMTRFDGNFPDEVSAEQYAAEENLPGRFGRTGVPSCLRPRHSRKHGPKAHAESPLIGYPPLPAPRARTEEIAPCTSSTTA